VGEEDRQMRGGEVRVSEFIGR